MAKLLEITLLQQAEQHVLLIENHTNMQNFGPQIGEGFMKIGAYLNELNEVPADIPFAEYPAYEQMTDEDITVNVGFYTTRPLPAKDDIKSITIPARKIAVCLHKGTYEALAELYLEMAEWMKAKGYEPNGTSIEHYYTGPEVPESEHITRIVMPLK